MLVELLAGIENSALAGALRGSTWIYPLVNTGHIIGVALFFGAIAPVDLRLIGVWAGIPLTHVTRILVPMATAGLVLAVSFGMLLFSTRASEYAASWLFWLKMLLLLLGFVNAAVYLIAHRRAENNDAIMPVSSRVTLGLSSLVLWTGVIVLGRLVGYF